MLADYRRAFQSYSSNVRLILVVSAIMGFTVDGVFPVIFNLYILRMGYGPEFVGQVNSVALLVFSFASLPAGTLGMRLGARYIMVLGNFICLGSTAALAVTDMLPTTYQPAWLMTMFSLLYLGVAFYFVNSSPALVNATAGIERTRVISIQSALGNLLAFVGGPMAGFVPLLLVALLGWSTASAATYRVPIAISAALFGLGCLLILRVTNLTLEGDESPNSAPGSLPGAPPVAIAFAGTLIVLSLIRFLTAIGTGSGLTFFNVYMDDGLGVSTALIGLVMAAARLLSVFAALAVPAIVARWGAAYTSVAGAFGVAVSLLPLALIPFWPVAGLAFVALNATSAIRYSAYFVYMMEVTPPKFRTTIAGAGEFSGGLGFALVSLVGGYAIVLYGYPSLFLGSALATFAGAGLLWFYVGWRRAREPLAAPAVVQSAHTAAPADAPALPVDAAD